MGRPAEAGEPRDTRVNLRLTASEALTLEQKRSARGLSVSAYLRQLIEEDSRG